MVASSNPAHARLAEEIASQLEEKVGQWGVFLEQVAVTGTAKSPIIRVFVDLPDGPGQLDSSTLEEATRQISQFFDQLDPVPGSYTLEVSTPGADRELTTPRHWRRSVGLQVRVETASEGEKIGTLVAVDTAKNSYTLRSKEQPGKDKSDKDNSQGTYEGSLLDVKSAQVVLDWSRA